MDENSPETAASDETKRKFREALERKKQAQHGPATGVGGSGTVRDAHGKAGGKREFRRKSG